MKCSRKGCRNEAVVHSTFGILPCEACQARDGGIPKRKFEFASISKLHRVQAQRDRHADSLLQPYEGNKVNREFFERYPDMVSEYGVASELEKA